MARTDARLELCKARRSSAALELNPLLVVRYVAVLQGTCLPPTFASSPGLVLPAVLQGHVQAPLADVAVTAIHPATLVSTAPAMVTDITASVVIEAGLAVTARPALYQFEADYDINVFRGPSHISQGHWNLAPEVTASVASDWSRPDVLQTTNVSDWQEGAPLTATVVDLSAQMPRCTALKQERFTEGLPLGVSHGQGFTSLPPGHAINQSLWAEGIALGHWQVGGYRDPPARTRSGRPTAGRRASRSGSSLLASAGSLARLFIRAGWTGGRRRCSPPGGPARPPSRPSSRSGQTNAPRRWCLADPVGMPPWSLFGSGRPTSLFQPGGFTW